MGRGAVSEPAALSSQDAQNIPSRIELFRESQLTERARQVSWVVRGRRPCPAPTQLTLARLGNASRPREEVRRVWPASGFRPALQSLSRHHLTRPVYQRQGGGHFAQQTCHEPLGRMLGYRTGPSFGHAPTCEGRRLRIPIGRMLGSTRARDANEKPRLIEAVRSHRRGGGSLSIKPWL